MALLLTKAEYSEGYYDIYNVHGYSGTEAFKDCISSLKQNRPDTEYWMTEEMPFKIEDLNKKIYSCVDTYIAFLENDYNKFLHMGMPSDEVFFTYDTQSPTSCYHVTGVLQNFMRKCDELAVKYSEFKESEIFTLKHSFKRTDGKYLSILGSNPLECNVYIEGEIERAYDIYGNPVEIEVADGTSKVGLKNTLYLITEKPIVIKDVKITSELILISNGSFEDNIGDIATGGLETGRPINWIFRDKTYDPAGAIVLSREAAAGQYAVSINSSGQGRVYVHQDVKFRSAGDYKVTVKIRKTSGDSDMKPYVFFFDRDSNKVINMTFDDVTDTGYNTFTAKFNVPAKSVNNAAIGIGILSGKGGILIDDVKMEKLE